MFNLGGPEMLLLGILALLLFGPKKLPELGRALGQGLAAFKEGSRALTDEFTRQLEDETREPRQAPAIPADVLLPPPGSPMTASTSDLKPAPAAGAEEAAEADEAAGIAENGTETEERVGHPEPATEAHPMA